MEAASIDGVVTSPTVHTLVRLDQLLRLLELFFGVLPPSVVFELLLVAERLITGVAWVLES